MAFLVVDDDWLARGAITQTLRELKPDDDAVEAATLSEAVSRLDNHPDITFSLIDLNLPDSSGIETLTAFRKWSEASDRPIRIVVVAGCDEPRLISLAFEQGVTGYIPKATPPNVFRHALSITLAGGVYIPEALIPSLRLAAAEGATTDADSLSTPPLTTQERRVAALLIRGLTYKQIAREFAKRGREITDNTVRAHVGNIAYKLGVSRNAKAGVMAEIARRRLTFDDADMNG